MPWWGQHLVHWEAQICQAQTSFLSPIPLSPTSYSQLCWFPHDTCISLRKSPVLASCTHCSYSFTPQPGPSRDHPWDLYVFFPTLIPTESQVLGPLIPVPTLRSIPDIRHSVLLWYCVISLPSDTCYPVRVPLFPPLELSIVEPGSQELIWQWE